MNLEFLKNFSAIFEVVTKASDLVSETKSLISGKSEEAKETIKKDVEADQEDTISHSHLSDMRKSAAHILIDLKEIMNEITELFGLSKDDNKDEETSTKKQMLELAKEKE